MLRGSYPNGAADSRAAGSDQVRASRGSPHCLPLIIHLFLPNQLDKPMLCPIAIARGMSMGGHTLNFDEQWVLVFKRVGDKIHLLRRNVHFQAKRGTPAAKAVETTYTDSVLMALKIHSIHPQRQSGLIDL